MLGIAILAVSASTAVGSVTRGFWPSPPHDPMKCYARPAPSLCLIHYWVGRTWKAEGRRGIARTPYGAEAERTTSLAFQTWIKLVWRSRARHYESLPIWPWPSSWLAQAMCVHSHEASWHNPTGIGPQVSGGMQIGLHEWLHFGGGAYAPAAYLATPAEQLDIAYRYYRVSGWSPWPNTSAMCGL